MVFFFKFYHFCILQSDYYCSDCRNGSAPNCVDYVEFGREDIVPFITLERSGRLCGERTGFAFDEPEGQLLIWLRLGTAEQTVGCI